MAGRMRTPHTGPDKKGHGFGLGMGSSGTKRPMGLLPMPFDLRDEAAPAKPEAHVADGPDRCLRAMPATRLAGGLPGGRGETARRRLTPATHGLLPMDQPLMRRDETRAAQRRIGGRPEPVGLAGSKATRLDKGLTRGYLDGRFGGIPTAGEAGSRGQKEGQPPQAQDRRPRASCRMPGECRGAD